VRKPERAREGSATPEIAEARRAERSTLFADATRSACARGAPATLPTATADMTQAEVEAMESAVGADLSAAKFGKTGSRTASSALI
jgi:hypothetical protein